MPTSFTRARIRATTACLAAIALTACADDSPLLHVPSQVGIAPAPAFAEAVDSAREAVRRQIRRSNLPGMSVAVARGGEIVWTEAFGWADLSREELATPATLYPVGSISKSLTATAAGLLYERGRLDFDVPIQTYLPEFPEKKWPITTGQLMGHIAGVVRSDGMAETLRQSRCDNARAAIKAVADDTLEFEPGTKWQYSNLGWQLVGAIVESAAGEPYLEFMDREVFDRAGMTQTVPDLAAEDAESVKYDRASYSALRRGQDVDMSCPMAAGGFLSTPTELVKFGLAMKSGRLLDTATVRLFWTPQRLKSGAPTEYGYGWFIGNTRLAPKDPAPTRIIGHGGAVIGGRASLSIVPEADLVIAVMTNATGNVEGVARAIAGFFR